MWCNLTLLHSPDAIVQHAHAATGVGQDPCNHLSLDPETIVYPRSISSSALVVVTIFFLMLFNALEVLLSCQMSGPVVAKPWTFRNGHRPDDMWDKLCHLHPNKTPWKMSVLDRSRKARGWLYAPSSSKWLRHQSRHITNLSSWPSHNVLCCLQAIFLTRFLCGNRR